MSIKMLANRTVYRPGEAIEYKKGETFMVETEKEASRLERTRRAQRVNEAAEVPKLPPHRARVERTQVQTKVMTPDASPQPPEVKPVPAEQSAAETGPAPAASVDPVTPLETPRGRYQRSDLRSED